MSIKKYDYLPHLDFETEWWYFTGFLNEKYGFEFTVFLAKPRFLPLGGSFMAVRPSLTHFTVTDLERNKFFFTEWMKWTDFTHEGVEGNLLKMRSKYMRFETNGKEYLIQADGEEYELVLHGENEKGIVPHGEDGIIEMPEGKSYYYTAPRCKATGFLRIEETFRSVSGNFWHDHQWGNFQVKGGWDWLGIRLENKTEIMVFRIKNKKGNLISKYLSVVLPDGTVQKFDSFTLTPLSENEKYPAEWELEFEKGKLFVKSVPIKQVIRSKIPSVPEYAEMLSFVEGALFGEKTKGYAFVEITNGMR